MVQLPALSNYTLNRGCIDVSKFDEIAGLAIDNYGIVTAALGTVRDNSDICHTVDEAVVWVNKFVAQIEQA